MNNVSNPIPHGDPHTPATPRYTYLASSYRTHLYPNQDEVLVSRSPGTSLGKVRDPPKPSILHNVTQYPPGINTLQDDKRSRETAYRIKV